MWLGLAIEHLALLGPQCRWLCHLDLQGIDHCSGLDLGLESYGTVLSYCIGHDIDLLPLEQRWQLEARSDQPQHRHAGLG